jgi:V/A-type H+-transporting ATPase subunit I
VSLFEHAISEAERDQVPVVLYNPAPIRPFELLLSLLSPPRYGSIDPTPFLAVFFPLFFGLMLGDVGYGLVLLALTLLARARRWGGETGRRVTTIALVCSVSAIVFRRAVRRAVRRAGADRHSPAAVQPGDGRAVFLGLASRSGVPRGAGSASACSRRCAATERHKALAKATTLAVIAPPPSPRWPAQATTSRPASGGGRSTRSARCSSC